MDTMYNLSQIYSSIFTIRSLNQVTTISCLDYSNSSLPSFFGFYLAFFQITSKSFSALLTTFQTWRHSVSRTHQNLVFFKAFKLPISSAQNTLSILCITGYLFIGFSLNVTSLNINILFIQNRIIPYLSTHFFHNICHNML